MDYRAWLICFYRVALMAVIVDVAVIQLFL